MLSSAAKKEPIITSEVKNQLDLEARGEKEQAHPQRVVGGYRLTRLLGRGGMAEVWLGVHETSRGLAAVKILRKNAAKCMRLFFERERRTVLRLRHPNIVPIFDVGEDYIAAAYIEGVDLRHRMRSPLSPFEAVAITRAIGSALVSAHELGVIHCDVKPANILLDRAGTPFLADFGIARIVSEPEQREGASQAGTLAYMAPEQALGREPTPASDQYALARTLLVMLAGYKLPKRTADALEFLPDELGLAIGATLSRAMSLLPEERYKSVQDFIDVLMDADVIDLREPDLLVSHRRDFRRFAWVKRPKHVQRYGESIARADYSLSDLASEGLLERDAVTRFHQQTGHADFTWSMYARDERLGPLTHPFALARARETVVLLHGLFMNREVWKDVAVGIARDNGLAVALTPDLLGFGESPFADGASAALCSPDRLVSSTTEWLELIGLGRAPTVMLGHSISALALMCVRQSDLGPEVNRICVTPVLPSSRRSARLTVYLYRFLAFVISWLPRWLLRKVARVLFRRDPSLQRISVPARDEMAESAVRLGTRRVASLFRWLERARLAPPDEIQSCTVVTTHDDPLVSIKLVEETIRAAGVTEERRFQLVYGGHFPQLIDEAHPEWGARNVHELISVIDTVLDMTHGTISSVRHEGNTANAWAATETSVTTPVESRGHED